MLNLEKLEFYKSVDPRYFQFAALGTLTCLQVVGSDFGTSLEILTLTLYSVAFVHIALSFILGTHHFDVRSSLISAFSLSLLLRSNELWIYPLAALLAVGSKALITHKGKHMFNPAAFAIASLLLLMPQTVWVSIGQWGNFSWFAGLIVCLGAMVLTRSRSADISLFFIGSWALLCFGRAFYLGDPLSIPLHQMQSGALLIFTFFMISDPMTAPVHRMARLLFAAAVAALAFFLFFEYRIREALFYSLIIISCITPILNHIWRAERFIWMKKEEHLSS
jgi:Na+-transporting NADH:ubiquinone oxidoreductase subunit NqrB